MLDPNVNIADRVGALADLIRKGMVRFIGLSKASAALITRLQATSYHGFGNNYLMLTRDMETEALPTIRELGIGLVAYA